MGRRRICGDASAGGDFDFLPGSSPKPTAFECSPQARRHGAQRQRAPVFTPRNPAQARLLELLTGPQAIVVAVGSAGVGKTAAAATVGAALLHSGEVSRIVITRPAVCADEEHGFLPGTLEDKMDPWVRPIFDVLNGVFGAGNVRDMVDDKVVELCPLAYCRGRTFNDAWVIFDEAQNASRNQCLMLLTRIGRGSKLVITGDLEQSDLRGVNGLQDLMGRLGRGRYPDIGVCRFGPGDVVRHPIVATVLRMYRDDAAAESSSFNPGDADAKAQSSSFNPGDDDCDPASRTVGFDC